mmetsp:Transcript_1245/g.2751  ORF Transcript_1245/g.2751 Transcript_1245/m.2751 type:complete len:219 (-) Transcript_1245:93-749(-)
MVFARSRSAIHCVTRSGSGSSSTYYLEGLCQLSSPAAAAQLFVLADAGKKITRRALRIRKCLVDDETCSFALRAFLHNFCSFFDKELLLVQEEVEGLQLPAYILEVVHARRVCGNQLPHVFLLIGRGPCRLTVRPENIVRIRESVQTFPGCRHLAAVVASHLQSIIRFVLLRDPLDVQLEHELAFACHGLRWALALGRGGAVIANLDFRRGLQLQLLF